MKAHHETQARAPTINRGQLENSSLGYLIADMCGRALLPQTAWMGCNQGEGQETLCNHLPSIFLGENKCQTVLVPSPVPIPSSRDIFQRENLMVWGGLDSNVSQQ